MFSLTMMGRRPLAPRATVARHVHEQAYAAVVLAGGYEEAGEGGRWQVGPGDVLVHAPFSVHWDRVRDSGARVLNLPMEPAFIATSRLGRVADPDLLARLAERDVPAAAAALSEGFVGADGGCSDAPDLLARALSHGQAPGVRAWSTAHGVARETAFRWFRSAYGVSPTRYRVEARARLAWRMIVDGGLALAEIAAAVGFADQAHMSRDVRAFTGHSPGAWRRRTALQPSFKTRGAAPPTIGA